ncbi:AfsR/SARP family transcriptional regulator [Nonomuraea sp. NPDC050556]|uniref:AfsR/SARP family transcriptional regulator n=1 Tax=Nonomuraea sp. NPDC050556 TaxID=3364369 RepID=UPI00378A3FC0
MGVRVAVMGSVKAWRDGQEVPVGSPQQRKVLAALVLAGDRVVMVDELVDLLWGDDPAPTAEPTVRTYVSRLRRSLGAERLVSVGRGYTLHGVSSDVAEFEERVEAGEYRRALALWSGEPKECAPIQRARLEEARAAAVEALCEEEVGNGRPHAVLRELADLVARYPLRERVRALQMRALHAAGRTAEAMEIFDDVRTLLDDELGVEPGRELLELRELLSERPVPAQLPPDTADFTGRAELVADLAAALRAGGGRALSVSGIGGVGKTTLAVHVAHQVREAFPDGQLYADLRGVEEPGVVVAAFLRALGVPEEQVPAELDAGAALLRTQLSDRRVLVVLDNARDSAQVGPLLPGTPSCGALLTSRTRMFDLVNARVVDLDVLTPEESTTLLGRIVGPDRVAAERGEAAELLELCGHLPLAVRVMGARLAARPGRTLADERARLSVLRTGELGVEAAFELSYRQLDPAQARAFRLAALPDAPDLSLEAASALLGLEEREAEDLLDSLIDLSLLESRAPGRYRYHDLLKVYARGHRDDEAERALERLAGFYHASVVRAVRLQAPDALLLRYLSAGEAGGLGFGSKHEVLTWLDAELDGLLLVVEQLGRTAGGPALRLAAEIVPALCEVSQQIVRHEAVERVLRALIDGARRCGDLVSEVYARSWLGLQLLWRNRPLEAEAVLSDVLPLTRQHFLEPFTLHAFLALHHRFGRIAEGLEGAAELLELHTRLDNPEGVANSLSLLARLNAEAGHGGRAVELAERAVDLNRRRGHDSETADALYQHGVILISVGRHEEAITRLTESVALHQLMREPTWQALALGRRASALLDLGRLDAAEEDAREALDLCLTVGERFGEGLALSVLGQVAIARGEHGQARERLTTARAIFAEMGDDLEVDRLTALLRASGDPA